MSSSPDLLQEPCIGTRLGKFTKVKSIMRDGAKRQQEVEDAMKRLNMNKRTGIAPVIKPDWIKDLGEMEGRNLKRNTY